jgi:hypothetical protein
MAELSTPKAFLVLAASLILTACPGDHSDDRQEEQQVVRAQRLSRARAQRARRARQERNRQRNGSQPTKAGVSPPSPVTISNPCDPGAELKRRAGSSLFNDRFAQALRLVAAPIQADLVELDGKPVQRFTFTVRMHPDDAPRFHRPLRPAELLLDLRFAPVCGQGGGIRKSVQLRIRLEKGDRKKSRSKTTTSLWPQRSRGASFVIPVGTPIQLLLDPTRATLRGGVRPRKGSTTLGLWEILAARFAGRPRTARLSLATSGLPADLRQLHVIEVVCGKKRNKQCRFLTRLQGRRARVTSWKELVKLAAPIQTVARVRQLHAAELSLRFPRCVGDARRPTRQQTAKHGRRSRCFGQGANHQACQFWRAQHGYGNEAEITSLFSGFAVRHVIACPGKKLRVLELQATYKRKGHHSLTVTDLTPRASQLLQNVRRLTSPGRR